ncbi:MAG: pyroglutamyl-peptidase I [Lachnospiraceae bacterium]|nr:pyroglutamyl-peptidase I [Lachnospiraceae bacterium]
MKKILFTGFEPFGGESVNPSWEAVSLLPDRIGLAEIAKRHLPVEYDTVADLLRQAIEEEQPHAVICVGQAGGRAVLTPEMVAINLNDAAIPDNAGVSHGGETICQDGPAAYFATIPVKAISAGMMEAGVPAAVSYTAGTYVCNNAMYHLLHLLAGEYPEIRGGFIHVPYECGQVLGKSNMSSLPLPMIAKGLEAAAKVTAEVLEAGTQDIRIACGSTH